MHRFSYIALPTKVIFGWGQITQVGQEISAMGGHRALVLCTQEQRKLGNHVSSLLGKQSVGVFDRAVMHVPIEIAREARQTALDLGADCIVAVGGGSTTGLGKAIALESGLPILAIPTTYAGSEMTPIFGITEGGLKKTGRDPRVMPKTVIYDPELSLDLPFSMTVTSGINAIAHAAEGLYAGDSNPVVSLMAEEGIAAIRRALPLLKKCHRDENGRSDALYGAWLCGIVLGQVGMGLHHKLCHTLGATFELHHAEVHAIVLPHALAYNASAAPQAMERIAKALNGNSAPLGIYNLALDYGAPVALKDVGMREADLDIACDLSMKNQYANPKPLERHALRELLQNAFEGVRPQT